MFKLTFNCFRKNLAIFIIPLKIKPISVSAFAPLYASINQYGSSIHIKPQLSYDNIEHYIYSIFLLDQIFSFRLNKFYKAFLLSLSNTPINPFRIDLRKLLLLYLSFTIFSALSLSSLIHFSSFIE